MLFDPLIDDVATVLAIRAKAITALQAGSQVVSWSVGDASASNLVTLAPEKVIKECNAFLKAVDPDTYGRRIRKVSPVYGY